MRTIFADALYWVALSNPHDQWHQRAVAANVALQNVRLIVTDSVLVEVANFYAEYGSLMRHKIALVIHTIIADEQVEVLPQTREIFLDAIKLYEARPDKGYSLTDCISMNAMRERGIDEVLTHDRHFAQEGFTLLL